MGEKIKQFIAFTRELFLGSSKGFALKKYSKIRTLAFVSSIFVFTIISGTIVPFYFKESTTEAASTSTHPSTITFTSTRDNAVVTINPTDTGVFAASTTANSIKFSIATDNYTGYTLTAKSGRTTLNNGSSTIASLSSAITQSTFNSSTTYNNRWGYRPNYFNSASNSRFRPSPTSSGSVLDSTTAANSTAKSYTIILGARVTTDIPAGTYINDVFVLEYAANPVPYSISFDDATDDDIVSNMPSTFTGTSVSDANVTLPGTIPTRVNYTFAGWCSTIPVATAGGYSCGGTTYAASSDYEINFTADNTGNTLYAIWTSNRGCNKAATTIGTGVTATDAVCMQDINDTVISTMTTGTQYTLKDMRDGKNYFIAKQADGKVWMTQNLDFDLSTPVTLTHDNTDLGHTTNTLNQTWTPSRATLTGNVSNWHNDATAVDSFDPGNQYYYSSGTLDDDSVSTACNDSSTCGHYHSGNYYNWRAAVANNITDNTTLYSAMPDSVCPAGWRLIKGPTSDYTYGEDVILFSAQDGYSVYYDEPIKVNYSQSLNGLNVLRNSPIYWNRAGYIKETAFMAEGNVTTFWTNIVYDSDSAYDVWSRASYFTVRDFTNKAYGFPVRCIARMTTGTTTVNFFGNGATSGTMDSRTVDSGDAVNIVNQFEKEGHKFVSWNTAADGTGTEYTGNAFVAMPTQNVTLNLYAQWEEAFVIKYDGNNATGTTTMSVRHEVAENEEITLFASNYSRSGYGFLGWSTTQINPDASNASTLIENATVFGPNETITASASVLNQTFPGDVTLYAVWIKSAGNLQGWTGCSSMSTNDVTALKDTRDNQVYAVAKLADGHCWMIENLRLDSEYSSDSSKAQGFGGNFWGLPSSESTTLTITAVENSLYTPNPLSTTKKIISGDNIEYRIPRQDSYSVSLAVGNMKKADANVYSYGSYYNWPAAIANTNNFTTVESSENIGTSICPAGWRLPTGYTNGEVSTLNTVLNNDTEANSIGYRKYPNNFVYSGYVSTSVYQRGTHGIYWTQSANPDSTRASSLYFSSSFAYKSAYSTKTLGLAVRCIAAAGLELKLDANDESNREAKLYGSINSTIDIPEKAFVRDGYAITSWNTAADGSGTAYTTTINITSNITLYAQWSPAYSIRYHGNNHSSNTDMDYYSHLNVADGEEINLQTSNYSRTGYGFLGWSFTQIDPDAANAETLIANTKIYGPNETITVNSTTIGQAAPADVYIYAVWLKSSGNLQTWKGCNALTKTTYSNGTITPGSVVALTDIRDGETYAVARLTDGNCWMIENLRLDIKTANITSTNTHNPTNSFLTNRTGNYSWCNTGNADCAERYLQLKSPTFIGIGYYYNYYTMSVGRGEYASNDPITGDICPAGWHVPSSYDSGTEIVNWILSLGGINDNHNDSTTPTGTVMSQRFRAYPQNIVKSGTTYNGTSFNYPNFGYLSTRYLWSNGENYYYNYLGVSDNEVQKRNGQLKYYARPVRCLKDMGTITYNGNGATGSGTMSSTLHSDLNNSSTTLFASNYSRTGYGFVGWSLTQIDPDAANAATQIANATIYGPNETINVEDLGTDDAVLYAVWVKSAGNLQNWSGCPSLAQGSVTALKDTRDNQVYAVAKLADGKCWMIENLRLNAGNSTDPTKSQGFGGVFEGLANSEGGSWDNSILANSKYTTDSTSNSLIVIKGDRLDERIPRYNSYNTTNTVSTMTSGDSNVYSYGNYYNYPAVMANTKYITSAENDMVGTSICPAGWKLPSGNGTTSDYGAMIEAVTTSNLKKFPNNFINAGYYNNLMISGRGTSGEYATNSLSYIGLNWATYQAYYMSMPFGSMLGAAGLGNNGLTVRCVIPTGVEVKLDSNDGTDKVARIYAEAGATITLTLDMFENEEYSISSWNTADDGSGTSYTTSYTVPSSNVTLYAQWDDAYEIRYNGNNHTSGTNMNMFTHSNVRNNTEIMLYANNYGRTGYGFLGWSTTQINPDAANAETLIANAKIFGPNETITVNSTTMGVTAPATITLYAVWLKSSGTLQSWNGCRAMSSATYSNGNITTGGIIALTDERDNNTYTVAKLPDGRCWMIENLRLDPKTADITEDNTNSPTRTFLNNRTNTYTDCSSNCTNSAGTERVIYTTNTNSTYSGTYYNWYTATGGNGTYVASDPTGDICPAGWHLPTSGTVSSSEYGALYTSIGGLLANLDSTTDPTAAVFSARLRKYPLNIIYSGYYYQSDYINRYREESNLWSTHAWGTTGRYAYANPAEDENVQLTYGRNTLARVRMRCVKNLSTVVYDGNGASSETTMKVTHTATPNASINLYASNYKRPGYGFLGWSLTQIDPDASDAATQIANATIYGPNQTMTLPSVLEDTTVLYAVWIKSAGDMQGWTGCSSLSSGGVTALKDTRDNQVYAVAKLADGNCWMIENLRLSNDYDNTDWGDKTKSQGFGGVFNGLATSELVTITSAATANSIYTADSSLNSEYVIYGDNTQYRIPRYNDSNTANTVERMVNSSENIYSYGNYYNFAAVKANTNEMASVTESENSGTSICPAGWRIPTSSNTAGDNKEFELLNTAVNSGSIIDSTGLRSYPNNFIFSGYVWTSTIYSKGSRAYYWSASAANGSGAYRFGFQDGELQIGESVFRSVAAPVRCISASGTEITLNSNNGSGKIARIYGNANSTISLPQDTFFYNGHAFASWNTAANGTGTSYTNTYTITTSTTLYAQWSAAYNIIYNGNGATSTTNMNAFVHSGVSNGASVMLYANNYAKTGYGFLGWSTTQIDPDANDFATQLSNAKVFGPNETIIANSTTLGVSVPATVTLYAVWVKSEGNLQTWDGCGRLTEATYSDGTITPGGVTALTDVRDGNTYAVAKLPDGQCWMIEALRIDPKTANITADNTDYPTENFLTNRTTTYSWCSTDNAACTERVLYRNPRMVEQSGKYYNWYTVTAGNGLRDSDDGTAGSLCPAGWHIPTGGTGGEYANLGYALGGNKANHSTTTTPTGAVMASRYRTYPINFLYGGNTYNTTNDYSYRTWGYYSASTGWHNSSSTSQYFLGISDTEVRYSYGSRKYNAYLARCIKGGGRIEYNGNGATNSTAMDEAKHTQLTANSEVTLNPSNYQRSGYGFLGWSLTQIDPDASDAATQIANATIYGPNETINTTGFQDSETLYAVWIKSAGNLQGWTGCSSLSTGGVTALKDTRDNQVYAVAKLADGNCWMIENLRLDAANSTDSTKAQGFGGVFEGLASSELTSITSDSILPNSKYTTDLTSNSLTIIRGNNPAYRIPRYNNANTASAVASMTSREENVYSYGNYYNWPAATANTSDITSRIENYGTSLCPAGWRMPTGGSAEKEFGYLNEVANSGLTNTDAGLRAYPNNFVLSGYINTSIISGRGTGATYYWSNSNNDYNGGYAFKLNNGVVSNPSVYKQVSAAIRCIVAPGIEIKLDANDGTDRVARLYGASGDTINLPFDESFYNENYKISSWNTSANGSGTDYTTTFTVPSSNTTLYAQWNTAAYTIVYNGNGASSTYNMNTISHPNIADGDSVTLSIANYSRFGYGFLGWSTTQINPDASNASTLIANAKIFGPNETIIANSTNLGVSAPATVTLYAVWLKSSGSIQDWTAASCESMTAATYENGVITTGSIIALTDSRDSNTYAVAKLADGQCWMIENLRLNPSGTSITTGNTNNPTAEFISNRNNTYEWCNTNDESCNADRVLSESSVFGANAGRWYNWYTATAGNGLLGTNDATAGDICPIGWHLPTGGNNSEFGALMQSLGGSTYYMSSSSTPTGAEMSERLRKYPYNFMYSGYKSGSNNFSGYGRYKSSIGYSYTSGETTYNYKYHLSIGSTFVDPRSGEYQYLGASVRCVKNAMIITYNGNGAATGSSMEITHKVKNGQEVTLVASNYKRTGYGFLGWSTTQINPDSPNFSSLLANATVYGPNETITIEDTADMTLYAVWIKSAGDMQGWTGCSSMSIGDVTARKDTRDNQVYAIAKLEDGQCWMIENLRLDNTYSNDSTKAQGFSGVFVGLAAPETTTLTDSTIANTLYTSDQSSQTLNIVTGNNISQRIPRYNNQNTSNTVSSMTGTNQNIYSYGNYYNFAASRASTNYDGVAGSSICPAGWRLSPSDLFATMEGLLDSSSETFNIDVANKMKEYPKNFIYAGYYYSSTYYDRGTSSAYWIDVPRTASESKYMPTMVVESEKSTYNHLLRTAGASVRCVAVSGIEVKLEANDGSSRVMRLYGDAGSSVTIPSESFERPGYVITSWNSNSNGSGTSYATSYSIPSGATSGITLYAQWSPSYTIIYDGNGATGSTSMAVRNEYVTEDATTNLYASNYSRSGYGFLGWSTTQIDPDASNASSLIAATTIFGPNETITANSSTLGQSLNGSPKTITLYAVWIKSAGNMQGWSGCSSMATGEVTARRDARDGNVYAIAKLADGNCWMVENLRLNNNSTSPNWGDATLSQGFGGVFNGLANSETTLTTSSTTANSLYTTGSATNGLIYVYSDGSEKYSLIPRYKAGSSNADSIMYSNDSTAYSYGNYYSLSAAIASTTNYTTASGTNGIESTGTSICPAGWVLPTYAVSNQLDTAIRTGTYEASGGDYTKYPNNFVYSGEINYSSFYRRGTQGRYIIQGLNGTSIRTLSFSTTNGWSGYSYAFTVRCLAASGVPITLDANDGSGRVARIYGTAGSTITLPTRNFSQSGQAISSWNTNATGTGTDYTTSYSIPSGSTGVTLYAKWGATYNIAYDGNNADGGGGMSIVIREVFPGTEITLHAPNFSRSGHGFLGWSDTQINPSASDFATQLANATVYGPNETITAPARTGDTLVLYAVWIKSAGNIQNWTGCSSLSNGGVTALTDLRDNQVYAVAKLSDGKCWMIENLRLSNNTYNTNWGDPTLSQGFGGVFNGLASSETTNFTNTTIGNDLYSIDGNTLYVLNSGDYATRTTNYASYYIPRFNNTNTTSTTSMSSNTGSAYEYGNYYTGSAALASTMYHNDLSGSYSAVASGTSICPAGWQLPTGSGSTSDYGTLISAANNSTIYPSSSAGLRKYPNNFVYSGYRSYSSPYNLGDRAYYWARNGYQSLQTYMYFTNTGSPYSSGSTSSYNGYSVRCVVASGVPVTLNANDGSGRVSRVYGTAGSSITLPAEEFSRDGSRVISWNTNAAGTGTTYTTSYNIPSGSTGETLYAKWGLSYTIVYDGNGATGTTTMDISHRNVVEGQEVPLYASNYSRSGYGFLGWSFTQIDPDASNATTLITNATIYGPNEIITAPARTGSTKTLYAVWVKSAGNMQNWSGCLSLPNNGFTALTDTRDGNTYAVALLADGKCWMVENLRLSHTASITTSNSQGFGGVFSGLATSETTFYSSATANSLYSTSNITGDNLVYRFPRYNNSNITSTVESMTSGNQNVYSYGNYYSWAAAVANTTDVSTLPDSEAFGTSICPKGWHIGSGGTESQKEYYNLGALNDLVAYPNNFVYSGYRYSSSVSSRGSAGYYWTRTAANGTQSYLLRVNDDGRNMSLFYAKYYGMPIRCTAGS